MFTVDNDNRKSRTRQMQNEGIAREIASQERSDGGSINQQRDNLFLSASKASKFSKIVPLHPSAQTISQTEGGSSEMSIQQVAEHMKIKSRQS